MEEDLDDELLALTQPKKEKRKRTKYSQELNCRTYASDSGDDIVSSSSDSEEDAFVDVKSWGSDLMGDAKDRQS